jgi:hypothetical protein
MVTKCIQKVFKCILGGTKCKANWPAKTEDRPSEKADKNKERCYSSSS